MSTTDTTGSEAPKRAQPKPTWSRLATAYYSVLVGSAALFGLVALLRLDLGSEWALAAVLTVCAALAQLFAVSGVKNNQSYRTSIVFIAAAAFLVEPGLTFVLAIVHYLPSWLRSRTSPKIQVFNIANTWLAALAAWGVARGVNDHVHAIGGSTRFAVAGAAACVAFVGVNHLLLALIIKLTAGRSLLRTGLFGFDSLSTDLVLAALGVAFTAFWHTNRLMTLFALAPLVIIHRAMYVPQLEQEAKVDAKTGLFNAKEFATALHHELARAKRFNRPLALIMCDLDYLRTINNTHGHLAGDAVLTGIAEILREEVREYDVAARFGGEEFSVLLPETSPEGACEIAERIRRALEVRIFTVDTVEEPIRATISLGVATFPTDATDARELIHAADIAVYKAKADGRNRVVRYVAAAEATELDERRRELHESPLGKSLLELEQEPPKAAAR